jgi:hypothetical protein
VVALARNWTEYLTLARRTAWGVPQEQYNELANLLDTARTLLAQATDDAERTRVVTAKCRAAFKALVVKLRFFKDRFYRVPPLSVGDMTALGLRPRDTASTPIPVPAAQAEADLLFPGIHLVELANIRAVGGAAPDARGGYGVRIYYGFSGPPSEKFPFRLTAAPKIGRDLPYSIFTRRRKERFDFDGESGNTVYFCLRYENPKGQAGPFGPIFSAGIP